MRLTPCMLRLTRGLLIALLLTSMSGILGVACTQVAPTDGCCSGDESGAPESCPLPCATCPSIAFVTPQRRDVAMPKAATSLVASPPDHRRETPPEPPRPAIFHPPRLSD